ncbi:MAG TPA: substrate-binding domain-containing protein, partial [Desulfopila sp.]|nr:substrate-binding domain-containing protein [Desulfopila sp.]
MIMKNVILAGIAVLLMAAGPSLAEDKVLTMSTTTSTQASGLLDILLPKFKKDTGIDIKVIAKGTGAAIRDGMDGNVDIIFVHARGREEAFVKEGYGTTRYAVMHNDFVILGPPADPAGIKEMGTASAALEKIAATGAQFISRGDDSGTHTKEQILWKSTHLKLAEQTQTIVKKGKDVEITFTSPADSDDWYVSIGQGMGKTITYADEKEAYALADRGTFIKYKY